MITIPKSRLPMSEPAKLALGGDQRRTIISKQLCPKTPEHKICKMQVSMGNMFAACSTDGYKKFTILCKLCKEDIATIYAKDKTLLDWRRFSYKSWHNNKFWYGLRGANIYPGTNALTLECCCDPEIRKTPDEFSIKEIT